MRWPGELLDHNRGASSVASTAKCFCDGAANVWAADGGAAVGQLMLWLLHRQSWSSGDLELVVQFGLRIISAMFAAHD